MLHDTPSTGPPERESPDNPATLASNWATSLSNIASQTGTKVKRVLTNLNLIGSLALLAALVSLWIDFRGTYTATEKAVTSLNPIAAGLLPSVLIGLTVFVTLWCLVYGWCCILWLRAKLDDDLSIRADLKKLTPDIEVGLLLLERVLQTEDANDKDRLVLAINYLCYELSESLADIVISDSLTSNLRDALHADDARLSANKINELKRLLEILAPLARRGNVKEIRRLI